MGFLVLLSICACVHCTLGEYPYYGKKIDDLVTGQSGLAGTLYAVDKDSFQIVGFSYSDGNSSDVAIVLGTGAAYEDAKAATQFPSNLVKVKSLVRKYENEKVSSLHVPGGEILTSYTYIAVANLNTEVMLSGANIPSAFQAPAPLDIGEFSHKAHSVRSGTVTLLDDRTISIKALRYDGQGPDAFFYVGTSEGVGLQQAPYGKIPDERGNIKDKAKAYSDRDIVLTLPATISATDLKWLSIYCIAYDDNFGHVTFPAVLNIPPAIGEVTIDREGMSCEPMSDKLQVAWVVKNDTIEFELAGSIDREKDYMAFGLSGSADTYKMLDADVVVADYQSEAGPRAVDYHLTAFSQCSSNGGVCPDTSTFIAANNDVTDVSGLMTDSIVRVRYTRPLNTGDAEHDKEYKKDGTKQQVVWAIGPLNTKIEAAKHYAGDRSSEAITLDFNREVKDNCPAFELKKVAPPPNFKPHHLIGHPGKNTVFVVDIGQAASEQGYKALTGLPSWGIAWYVNGILIPELHLKRGVSYTFRVGGGTDPSQGSMYHPLYFTDNIKGGYATSNNGTIYQGTVNGEKVDYATGGYCEWKLTAKAVKDADDGKIYNCFEEFKEDLYLDCAPNSKPYTDLVFTPDANTPSLLYYQCYTHESLGWKVNVYDELPDIKDPVGCDAVSFTSSCIFIIIAAALSFM